VKAAVVTKPGQGFEIVERDTPQPGPGQVRVKVDACGVCHSDAFVTEGHMPGIQYPRVPGHEVAGRVDAVGEGVELWNVGDRVGVGWHGGHCFHCDACRRGHFINCKNGKITGVSHDGGFAEMMLSPWEACARIPDELDAAEAGPLLCAGITTYNSLRNSGARAGDTVAVQGIGGLGHLAIQYARQMGFRVVAVSGSDSKRALAAELGAHEYVDGSKEDPAAALQKLGGADLVLATAPDSELIGAMLGGLSSRGQLLIVAAAATAMEVTPLHLLSGKRIQGWPSGSSIDSEDTMKFSALHGVKAKIERFPLEKVAEAFARVFSNEVRFRAVLTMT
jgi:D-arabinose 1-dehydrogenase-like Zn-dependent alcohol dehydrogenase